MIVWSDFPMGDHRTQCPVCARRDKSMGVTVLDNNHGVAHCFRCGLVESKQSNRELTPAERKAHARRMDALRKQHDTEQRERQAVAAVLASARWAAAEPAQDHAYLRAKGVKAYGLRLERETLLIPLRNVQGELKSLQTIAKDGTKRFVTDGQVKGCYHSIGKPSGRIVVCEGYATGATVHEDTGHAVAVAFNSGNLTPVAKAMRSKFPCVDLVIAADDDWRTEGNPGLTAAKAAAAAVGGLLAVPDFSGLARGHKDTDFNDLHRLTRIAEVSQ